MINETNPDFVWIGLGAPKQERWMASHQGKLNGLMVGVGAAFDYCAGNIKRAPKWMQRFGLEWLYRLVQDPKRLFKRYFVTNTKFILNAIVKGK
jgi:N-acetylglucosaminyldiphosphoundecaprenol N-acetyl-beta-D-mannosaminyltransferase